MNVIMNFHLHITILILFPVNVYIFYIQKSFDVSVIIIVTVSKVSWRDLGRKSISHDNYK